MKEEKHALRRKMIELRRKIPVSDRIDYSRAIVQKIQKLSIFKSAHYILLYWSMVDEVYTHDLVNNWKDKKNIILPVISEDILKLKKYTGEMKMFKTSRFNLLEPVGEFFVSPELIELAIIPGLAFDTDNNRLGYGKGYYDRLLRGMQTYKIGVCFNFQMLDKIPHTVDDIKMDTIITN